MEDVKRVSELCIIREYYEQNPPECEECGLLCVCERDLTAGQVQKVLDYIDRNRYRREFWEDLNDFYGDNTYSEV